MNLVALKNELTTDPLAKGYATMTDEQASNALNANGRDVSRETIEGGMLASAIVRTELALLTPADQNYVRTLVACDTLYLTANLKTELGAVFAAGTATRANFIALLKRPGSRAEELGLGFVTPSHVADARRA